MDGMPNIVSCRTRAGEEGCVQAAVSRHHIKAAAYNLFGQVEHHSRDLALDHVRGGRPTQQRWRHAQADDKDNKADARRVGRAEAYAMRHMRYVSQRANVTHQPFFVRCCSGGSRGSGGSGGCMLDT